MIGQSNVPIHAHKPRGEATSKYVVNLMVMNCILTMVIWMSSWDPNPPTDAGSLYMDGAVGSIFDILDR
jgi:hypothetical protein